MKKGALFRSKLRKTFDFFPALAYNKQGRAIGNGKPLRPEGHFDGRGSEGILN